MYYFFIPVFFVAALIAIAVAIYAANARRHGGSGERQPGQTVYDRDDSRRAPTTSPA